MNTIISMLREQAQAGRKIEGTTARIVPDNKKYELIDFNLESGKFTFQEVVGEDEDRVPDIQVVSETNALIAHMDRNPNPKPDYEATITDGVNGRKILVTGDKSIDMGTIKGIKVLAGTKGKVIFTVATDDEKVVDIWSYDVQFDRFDAVSTGFGANIRKVQLGEDVYLIDNIIIDVEQTDKDGNKIVDENGVIVAKPQLSSATVYSVSVSSAGENSYVYITEALSSDYSDESDDYDQDEDICDCVFEVPVDDIRLISQGERKDAVVVTSKKVDADGYLVDDDKVALSLYMYNEGLGSRVGTFFVSDAKAKVYLGGPTCKPPVVTVKDSDKILIRDKYGLKVIDDEQIVSEFAGFNFFCGTEPKKNDKDQQEVTFYYANEDRSEVKSFTQIFTDRGVLYRLNAQ